MAIDIKTRTETQSRTELKLVVVTEEVEILELRGLSTPVKCLVEQVLAQADTILENARKGQRADYTFRVSKHGSYAQFEDWEPAGSPDYQNVHGY